VRSGSGAARTILLFHIISARPPKQPCMVHTFLKAPTRSRLHMHYSAEVTESSASKQHHLSITQTPSNVQSRQAPALMNTCYDARFAPHYVLNVNAG
jgi:hypothetical protein